MSETTAFVVTDDDQLPPGAGSDIDPTPVENACPDCEFVGKTPRGLKRHQTVAHGSGDRPPKNVGGVQRNKKLREDLEALLTTVSVGLMMTGQEKLTVDGQIVAMNTEAVATAWANLAAKNKQVERVLMQLTGGMSYGEVITATAMMVAPILANHGLLPARVGAAFAPIVGRVADGGD